MSNLDTARAILMSTLESLVTALEAKDSYSRGHSERVADLAATIAAEMQLPDDEVDIIRMAGLLHDVGNVGIRDDLLHRRGPLSDTEREQVREHVRIGVRILEPIGQLASVTRLVACHHERWDGHGYPSGLAGEEIPLGARVLAAAEVYDALTTSRPYKVPVPRERALQIVESMAGNMLDPRVARSLIDLVQRRRTLSFLAVSEVEAPEAPARN